MRDTLIRIRTPVSYLSSTKNTRIFATRIPDVSEVILRMTVVQVELYYDLKTNLPILSTLRSGSVKLLANIQSSERCFVLKYSGNHHMHAMLRMLVYTESKVPWQES